MFIVVPVTEDDRKFVIVRMGFPWRMKYDRRTEAIDVLPLLTVSKEAPSTLFRHALECAWTQYVPHCPDVSTGTT